MTDYRGAALTRSADYTLIDGHDTRFPDFPNKNAMAKTRGARLGPDLRSWERGLPPVGCDRPQQCCFARGLLTTSYTTRRNRRLGARWRCDTHLAGVERRR